MAKDTKRREALDPDSLDGRAEKIRSAWRAQHDDDDDFGAWPTDVYDDHLVYEDAGQSYRVTYSIDAVGVITFGDPEKVKVEVEYTGAGDEAEAELLEGTERTDHLRRGFTGQLLESLDDGDGWRWRVTMIEAGISRNRTRYRSEVLREAATMYEGVKSFDGHRTIAEKRASSVGGMVGYFEGVTAEGDGRLTADWNIARSAPHIRALALTAHDAGRPDLIGFSHDVAAFTRPVTEGGVSITDVVKIAEVHSVDTVADPSAGGRLERLVASRQRGGSEMTHDEMLALLDGDEELAAAVRAHLADTSDPTPEEVAAAAEATKVAEAAKAAAKPKQITETAPVLLPAKGMALRMIVREAIDAHGGELPKASRNKLTTGLLESDRSEAEVVEAVERAADMWSAVLAAEPAALPGQKSAVTVLEGDKITKALDGMLSGHAIDGVQPFRSIREAYQTVTGRHPRYGDTEDEARRILAESVGGVARMGERLTESLVSSSWSSALGDSITRKAKADYREANFGDWRKIISEFTSPSDFRTQRRDGVGYYNVLSTVAEGAVYPALTSPSDEEASYAVTKKGGTEDLTIETIANDDLGMVRRIPRKLGRAAALTIARAVWVTIIAGNPAIYDGVVLFHASHGNTTADAFDGDGINVLRNLMLTQTIPGETSGALGAIPKYVIHPPELFKTVQETLVLGPGATTIETWKSLEPIEVPLLTDADDWFLVADPASVPTIEVGFLNGQQEPEIMVQDAPSVGSVFTADKVTFKVRHPWGLAVLDYRGFQRGTV